jgi:hypothetical protein
MKLTRRNALIGLGSLVAGSGALVGTGAFSQVTADRTASAQVVADNSGALLGFAVENSNIAQISGDTLEITANSLNQDAETVFEEVFTVTNNGEDGVGLRIRAFDSSDTELTSAITFDSAANSQDLTAYPTATGDDHNLDPTSGSVTVGITFDTTGANDPTQVSYIQVDAASSEYTA